MDTPRQYLSGMPRSVTRVLIAVIVAFAVAMPAGARVMPMVGTGMPMSTGMMEKTTDHRARTAPTTSPVAQPLIKCLAARPWPASPRQRWCPAPRHSQDVFRIARSMRGR